MRSSCAAAASSRRGLDDLASGSSSSAAASCPAGTASTAPSQEVKELLDRAVLEERKQLARDLDDDAPVRRDAHGEPARLHRGGGHRAVVDYDWRSGEAREAYEQIKDLLGRELLDQRFAGMKQALENATDEDRAAVDDMLDDLNDLLEAHARGEDTDEQFGEFMDKHGEFFPENPQNVDELLDALAAAGRRGPADAQLDDRPSSAPSSSSWRRRRSARPAAGVAGRLDANLRALRPGEDWGGSESFRRRAGARPRRRHRRAAGPRRARRAGRAAVAVSTAAPASTTSTSTR